MYNGYFIDPNNFYFVGKATKQNVKLDDGSTNNPDVINYQATTGFLMNRQSFCYQALSSGFSTLASSSNSMSVSVEHSYAPV